jgi:hypothetical protein
MSLCPRIVALTLALAQLFFSAQASAGDSDPFECAPAEQAHTITADFGPNPLIPARSDSGSSAATAASPWAATNDPVELLPLPTEAAPFIMAHDIPRAGYPPGVERPPRSSF